MPKKAGGPTFIQRSRRVGAETKAVYHNLAGAGRSKVKREFFGISAEDKTALVKQVQTWLDQVIK